MGFFNEKPEKPKHVSQDLWDRAFDPKDKPWKDISSEEANKIAEELAKKGHRI